MITKIRRVDEEIGVVKYLHYQIISFATTGSFNIWYANY